MGAGHHTLAVAIARPVAIAVPLPVERVPLGEAELDADHLVARDPHRRAEPARAVLELDLRTGDPNQVSGDAAAVLEHQRIGMCSDGYQQRHTERE